MMQCHLLGIVPRSFVVEAGLIRRQRFARHKPFLITISREVAEAHRSPRE